MKGPGSGFEPGQVYGVNRPPSLGLAAVIACIASPVSPPPVRTPVGVRARLWLRAAWLGQHNEDAFLWLHLRDGRVLAFRLPGDAFGDDQTIGALVAQVSDDLRGTLLEVPLAQGVAVPLYAAPAAPIPVLPWGDPTQTAARAFAEGLDQQVLTLLAGLNRHRVWDSLRNYNRVAALAPEIRERRLQALTRFPVLVAPVLLSAHQRLDLAGGKRHAWRDHSDQVIAAVEQGRDLIGALGRHYGISRGLVRSPVCATIWGGTALSHRRLLRLLDGIPAHRRPHSPDAFEPALPLLIGINLLADDRFDLARLGHSAFRAGFEAVCEPLHARYPALGPALADCQDFAQAAADWAPGLHPCGRPVSAKRLQLAWIETRGFASLLAASLRWHEHPADPPPPLPGDRTRVTAILGEHRDGDAWGRELCTAAALAEEGAAMRHCVAQYWDQCRDQGTRIFALGLGPRRATAEYRFGVDEARFSLAQMRGPCNAEPGPKLAAFAGAIAAQLNALGLAPARAELALSLTARRSRPAHRAPRRLDPASQRELTAVLAHIHPTPSDGELLREYVAGYQFHGGADIEVQMGVGDALDLIREPGNPHDPLAVALCWRGEPIGYVPRRVNADIARRLDAGQALGCRITRLDEGADSWERVEVAIRQAQA
jgi:hypothetical protein